MTGADASQNRRSDEAKERKPNPIVAIERFVEVQTKEIELNWSGTAPRVAPGVCLTNLVSILRYLSARMMLACTGV